MVRFVAFLRAINVGGRVVKMERLREAFESLGCEKVETFIASGNVIFESRVKDAEVLHKKIEKHLQAVLGYEVGTFLRSDAELARIATYKPFAASDLEGNTLYIAFLAEQPGRAAEAKLMELRNDADDFHVNGREVYWLLRRRTMSESLFSGARLEKTMGLPATMRNANTVVRLAAKYPAGK